MTPSRIGQLASAFLAGTLPRAEWTHAAHLRVGLWHLLHAEPDDALDRLRVGIRQYNEATGVANTETSGYHETLTRFYVWLIARFLAEWDRTRPADELADRLVERYGDRNLPLTYWSRERLFSSKARAAWVEPDLRPLGPDPVQ